METDVREPALDLVGAWAKRCYFAGRAVMDAALRPYDLGSVQWYVLHRLVEDGPTMQRDLVRRLSAENAVRETTAITELRAVLRRYDLGGCDDVSYACRRLLKRIDRQ